MGNTVTICFANNKGGSGKSTSCSNVGAALAGMGKKVLLVDGDMQLNLSLSFFDEEEVLKMAAGEKNLYYAIGHQSDLSDFIVHTKYENLDLVPSSTLMSSVEYELFTKWQREFILRKCLQKVKDSGVYDYILIDAPPTLGGWVMNIYVHRITFWFRWRQVRGACLVLQICLISSTKSVRSLRRFRFWGLW